MCEPRCESGLGEKVIVTLCVLLAFHEMFEIPQSDLIDIQPHFDSLRAAQVATSNCRASSDSGQRSN